jgi:integrase
LDVGERLKQQEQEEEPQKQTITTPKIDVFNHVNNEENVIYPVTECCNSEYTRQSYKNSFDRFLKYINVYDLQVLIDFGDKVLEQLIIKYVIHSRDEKKLARGSIEAELHAIFHFCELNDILIRKKRVRRFMPPERCAHDDRLYTSDEMQRIIGACRDKRQKVIILLMESAGIRIGSISKLKVKDLEHMNVNGYNTFKITVDADDRNARYWTTCTNECYIAVKEYYEQRQREGENPIEQNSPLIREHRDPRKMLKLEKPRHISDESVRCTVRALVRRSGVYVHDPKKQKLMMSHAFRKNFKTVCESSPMKSLYVEMLMGHREALVKSYMRPKDTDVISEFITHAANALTIDPTQRLKQENQELRKNQGDYLAELGDLRHEFNEIKRYLVHLSKDSQKQVVDEFFQKVGDKADIEWSCED